MRQLVPELIDQLAPDDPALARVRRDLACINFFMGNHRWLVRRLLTLARPGDRILELGAGDAVLARRVWGLRGRLPGISYHAVDRVPRPEDWPRDPDFVWHAGDLFGCEELERATIVVANLVLHHFEDAELERLGRGMKSARVVLAREPARQSEWMRLLLYPFGLHPVTRHDMLVSMRAGFLGSELSRSLGLVEPDWDASEHVSFFNAQCLEAVRRRE